MELLALFDGSFIRAVIWLVAGFCLGYFVPAPKFISDLFGNKK
jgi:hypothetical protein